MSAAPTARNYSYDETIQVILKYIDAQEVFNYVYGHCNLYETRTEWFFPKISLVSCELYSNIKSGTY